MHTTIILLRKISNDQRRWKEKCFYMKQTFFSHLHFLDNVMVHYPHCIYTISVEDKDILSIQGDSSSL
jgi:hypothetical protein